MSIPLSKVRQTNHNSYGMITRNLSQKTVSTVLSTIQGRRRHSIIGEALWVINL